MQTTPLWYAEAGEVSAGRERHPLELPIPSLKERDRRWAALREKMFFRGLECVVLVGSGGLSGSMANIRYITGLGPLVGALAVFPLHGDPIAFYGNRHEHIPFGGCSQIPGAWVDDVRPNTGVPGILAALAERGLGRGRIGVVANRFMLAPSSNVSAAFMDGLRRGVPEAVITDETSIVDELRLIKSEEELVFLRRAGAIARQRVERLAATARPGATEAAAWAAMEHEAIIRGGEPEPFNLFSSGPVSSPAADGRVQGLLHGSYPPYCASLRTLGEGDLIICEFHTNYGGYLAASEFSVFIGQAPEPLRRVHQVATEVVRMAGELFVPDRPLRDIYTAFHRHVEAAGMDFVELGFHGHGLAGIEFPAVVYREADLRATGQTGIGDIRLRENMVFGLNIDIHDPAWRRDVGVMLGDTVAVKPGGAEYLCNIPLDVFELQVA
jgi:Xaa-Pro aminopeptidase